MVRSALVCLKRLVGPVFIDSNKGALSMVKPNTHEGLDTAVQLWQWSKRLS